MKTPCLEIPLDQAAVGMTLAVNLHDAKGDVLLPQGATLTDATLSSLRRRGIETVTVVSEASDAEKGAELERQRQRLARLFRKSMDNEAAGTLLQYVTRYQSSKTA